MKNFHGLCDIHAELEVFNDEEASLMPTIKRPELERLLAFVREARTIFSVS